MLFTVGELDLLRLIRWCRYLPEREALAVFSRETVDTLLQLKLVSRYQKRGTLLITKRGNRFLEEHLSQLPPDTKPSYREEDCRRRECVARFMLTAYRAGLSVFETEPDALEREGTLYLTAQSRKKGQNPWGSSRIAALVHVGGVVCGVHYVRPGIGSLSLSDEVQVFRNSTAKLSCTDRGWIYTGESYESLLRALADRGNSDMISRITYGEAYRRLAYPFFLVPSNEVGARQLKMMRRPNYRLYMTKAALGAMYAPPPPERPAWDAMFKGTVLIMAADMDLKRVDLGVKTALSCGLPPPRLVALKGQEKVLLKRYKARGLVQSVFTFNRERAELVDELALYEPPLRAFEGEKGEVICVPFIKAAPKAGGSDRGARRELAGAP